MFDAEGAFGGFGDRDVGVVGVVVGGGGGGAVEGGVEGRVGAGDADAGDVAWVEGAGDDSGFGAGHGDVLCYAVLEVGEFGQRVYYVGC